MVATALPKPSARTESRAELFRLLGDEGRLQLLALCAEEELSVGELAELLADSQPQVSRKAAALRQAGLLAARKEGTRTYLSAALDDGDAVLVDAVAEGRRLAQKDGSLARIPRVVAAREEEGRRFFDEAAEVAPTPAAENPIVASYLAAFGALLPSRRLAVDVGCGEGLSLDVLAPLYERVVAVDRSPARLAVSARRVSDRGYSNVSLLGGSWDDTEVLRRAADAGGADLVLAGRVLHHASRPREAVAHFARLLRPGGHLLVLDYLPHGDESLREQGDVWLGFQPDDLRDHLEAVGLAAVRTGPLPVALYRSTSLPDAHLDWQVAVGSKPIPSPNLSA